MKSWSEEQQAFLRRCGGNPAELDLRIMRQLYEALVSANRQTNLTRITDEAEFWTLHVLDSLAVGWVVPELLRSSLRVADVGCGAGFPMLPLAWANPALQVTGIEARRKKVEFIQREIAALGLSHAQTISLQAREAGGTDSLAGAFDMVLLRAVGTAGKMLRECRQLLKNASGGKMVFYKTPAAVQAERSLAQREADKYGFTIRESEIIPLPHDAGDRQFLILEKP